MCRRSLHNGEKNTEGIQIICKRIPTMIKNNGLGPALAFVYAKGEPDANGNNAYTILYRNIDERLKKKSFFKRMIS